MNRNTGPKDKPVYKTVMELLKEELSAHEMNYLKNVLEYANIALIWLFTVY